VRRGALGEERVAFLCPDDQLETLNPKPRNPMLRNYLTVALRALRRSKGYTVINVVGFAVGIAVCLLIVLYVRHELSYDTFHEKSERLYRIVSQDSTGELSGATQAPMASAMARDFPAVEKAARLYGRSKTLFSYGQKRFYVEDGLRADSTFFDMLTFPLMRGNAETALQPGSIVLTEATAERFFGSENPMGQTLTLGTDEQRTVTGVVREPPSNSEITYDYLVPMPESLYGASLSRWNRFKGVETLVLLEEGQSPASVEAELPDFAETYIGDALGPGQTFSLLPLEDVYLSEIGAGDPRYLYVFSAIAALILLIACINYVNLATARSAQRAKEVGVRRAVGARRGQVARQFLGESVLLCGMALVGAVGLARALLPVFNALIGKDIAFVQSGAVLAGFAGAVLGVGLLAGLYPALFLSSFRPTDVLRGRLGGRFSGGALRKGLVVFQFAVSVALIAGTAVVFQQLRYVQTKKLGLDEEQVVAVPLESEDLQERYRTVRQEMLALPGVTEVTGTSAALTEGFAGGYTTPEGTDERRLVKFVNVAPNFTETLGIELAAGRDFSRERSDEQAILINEAAAREFGWAEPLGKTIPFFGEERRVVGVAKDFHFASMREEIAPLILIPEAESADYVMARLGAGTHVPSALDALEATYGQFGSAYPFAYSFLGDDYGALYRSEQRTGRVLAVFAALAVLIAGLGLFGLAAFAAEARSKEIAIRKALGASEWGVVRLLSKDFLLLVSAGFVLAVPVAWWATRQWLEGFAYRVDLGLWTFLVAGALALLVAAVTVSGQALRAARTNPAQALRDE